MSTAVLTNTWHERLAQLLALEAEADRHDTQVYDPLHAAFTALFPVWPSLDKEGRAEAERWMEESRLNWAHAHSDALSDQLSDLTTDLIKEPAPDRAAALWKFRHLYTGKNAGTEWHDEYVAQANADIERFLEN